MKNALVQKIARMLERARLDYERDPEIEGLRLDFLVHGSNGQSLIVEAKSWWSPSSGVGRAIKQAQHYKQVTGADHALLVVDSHKRGKLGPGVVGLDALLAEITKAFGPGVARAKSAAYTSRATRRSHKKANSRSTLAPTSAQKRAKPNVFAAMPFSGRYDDTYFVAMAHAAKKCGAVCERVDQGDFSGDIAEEIRRLIRSSAAVIVDLSESKPNVLYEAGYAHALNKPVVHICSTSFDDLPFDVRNWNALQYEIGRTAALRSPLARRLRVALAI